MKVPTNGLNGFEDDHYYGDMNLPAGNPTMNGNLLMDDYIPIPIPDPPAQEPDPDPSDLIESNDPSEDFAEYMWMENEEEFDKEVLAKLEEEELTEQCIFHHMLDNEMYIHQNERVSQPKEAPDPEVVKNSSLNPHAAEFVPSWSRSPEPEKRS